MIKERNIKAFIKKSNKKGQNTGDIKKLQNQRKKQKSEC